ncbi:MAG: XRE family transcriptional regulator [Bifidobacterium tibiigranuli]|jgi:transcriptional regulator with XRE-family HTH domain|nr:XRE family transcriptional regulator [Bifidobacterium tibiigranuli]
MESSEAQDMVTGENLTMTQGDDVMTPKNSQYHSAAKDDLKSVLAGIGMRVRTIRLKQGMTLQTLAERSGLSLSMLSTVERGAASPSVSTLYAISQALMVPVTALMVVDDQGDSPVRKSDDQISDVTTGGAVRKLAVFKPEFNIEIYRDSYAFGTQHARIASQHPGYEFGIILDGTLEIELSDAVFEAKEGDAVQFSASQPHLIKCASPTGAHAIWINLNRL